MEVSPFAQSCNCMQPKLLGFLKELTETVSPGLLYPFPPDSALENPDLQYE